MFGNSNPDFSNAINNGSQFPGVAKQRASKAKPFDVTTNNLAFIILLKADFI